ncbi:MAG: hypothetical protein HRU26_08915 [Psychroserpens sp.]|nr:hypothetical protein [Psychroserpens sp.]
MANNLNSRPVMTLLGTHYLYAINNAGTVEGRVLASDVVNLIGSPSGLNDLITLVGVPSGQDNLGTFSGSTLTDNSDLKTVLQDIEDAIEASTPTGDVWSIISTDTTAGSEGGMYVISGTNTLTFPSAPANGTQIKVARNDSTNTPSVIAGSGDTIEGVATAETLDVDKAATLFIYDAAGNNWIGFNLFTP